MNLNMPSRTASWVLAAALVTVLAAGGVVYAVSGRAAAPAGAATLTVEQTTVGRAIPTGFVGLTTEYRGLEAYAGGDPRALDPVFEQLIRNLAPNQRPVLRVGGDSTDWTWWPVPHMARPGGVKFDLTKRWLQVAAALGQALNARLILGVNFEADSGRVASAEAQAFMAGLGRNRIEALELGNEPELYAAFPWYKLPNGNHVRGRPATYDYRGFLQDFSNVARSLPSSMTTAGPSMGAPLWIPLLGQFLSANPHIGLATLHRYPLKHCSTTPVTVAEVLSSASSIGLAQTVAGAVTVAHRRGTALRIDEMSAISCGGMAGVSDSFATALWSLDALFAMARVGVDGVNFQTAPNSFNELFGISDVKGTWQANVHPAYYGMMMFAQAAPPGSRLLRLAGAPGGEVRAWATRAPNGEVRVVLINDATAGSRLVKVRIPSIGGPASLERLKAPSAQAQGGVTLGGQGFGLKTSTGLLAGTPAATSVTPVAGAYVVSLPAASAAMLTLTGGVRAPASRAG
jgi:hypothetical protein